MTLQGQKFRQLTAHGFRCDCFWIHSIAELDDKSISIVQLFLTQLKSIYNRELTCSLKILALTQRRKNYLV